MRIFITSTNTDVGKTFVTKHLYHALKACDYDVCIFKPFQTEELADGTYPDLEVFKNECDLSYDTTSLYTFKQPVSPHLAFKMTNQTYLNKQDVFDKVSALNEKFDFVLIEGAGGIGVPLYEGKESTYMTKDLINDCADSVISVLPSKLGAISDAIVHQDYMDRHVSPNNFLIMNRYTGSYIEKDNQITIGKLTNKTVYTLNEHARYEDFSEEFLQQLIGAKNELHTRT
ncbi:dethiobiotin synthase [Staphylococcus argenteus]|uniref:dethiobiotin synthase n=1 Tax=Staphylococcus argenteus TaxID=985002 RepID=UPI001FBA6041|nr:dethiobiotin synthase [Staphylococcus argenteus]MCG9795997.1 dethiobiotin synthase [Staphylococcus argenteus]GJF43167.1 dethiobiotin synthase [Staphylococcus argenteus]GJF59305.1 dethiobiotin synthase [Staphylococcus argenteus]GJF72829.1 dethiobiotin synthase [Staphylococcus argenteus]GJF85716.1 dethiobiotin synthase [Staphylococcus argenteus]